MQIVEAIIHKVAKERDTSGPDSIEVHPREGVLPLDENITKLCGDILKLYARLNPGYGTLGQDPTLHHFTAYLHDYTSSLSTGFSDFTRRTLGQIAQSMSQQRLTTTSYPLFIRYSNQGRDWVLIAVLKLKENISINEDTLDLNVAKVFAVQDLREAARIDIEKWQNEDQPYLSFIKRGSGSDAESSRYFRAALACLNYTDSKHHTDEAIKALNAYCSSKSMAPDQVLAVRESFFDYCDEKKNAGESVNLVAFSAQVNDQEPAEFIDFIRENEYSVNEIFSPHKTSFGKLRRIKKTFGSINISFDVDDLVTGNISVGDDQLSVSINNAPQDLIRSILQAQGELESQDDE